MRIIRTAADELPVHNQIRLQAPVDVGAAIFHAEAAYCLVDTEHHAAFLTHCFQPSQPLRVACKTNKPGNHIVAEGAAWRGGGGYVLVPGSDDGTPSTSTIASSEAC